MALQSNYYPVPIVAGTTAGTYAAGDDPRLSDERTPPDDVVTNAKLANVATATIKGRATAGTGDPEDLTASQVRTILNVADGAEVNVQSNWTEADSGSDAFILNKPTLGGAAALNVGTTTGTVCAGDDARLSDSRTPTSHATSHATGGSDPVFDQDLNTTDDVTFNSVSAGAVNAPFFEADYFSSIDATQTSVFPLLAVGDSSESNPNDGISFETTTAATNTRTNLGLGTAATADIGTGAGDVCAGDDSRLSDARTPTSHTHGNITNAGLVGTTANLPLKTGTGGIVEAGAFGTGAGEFAEGNHTHADLHTRSHAITSTSDHTAGNHKVFYSNGSGEIVELALGNSGEVLTSNGATSAPSFAAASGGGVTGAAASASDVLGVSGSDITGVDATADRIVFWDDSASALKYLEAGSGLSISGTTMTVTATGGATNLWIPASAFIPKTTAGCGVDSRETATNDQNFDELLFDAGSDEFADALVVMPSNYNNGTITARFYWTAASGSGGVAWAIQGRALANDDALDTAAGTAQLVTDTLIAADDMHVTSATSAVTIGGTPAANTPIQFTIYRDVSDAADDLAVDARLLGVEIIFN